MTRILEPRRSRFLVVGSGIAGLQFALLAAEHGDVHVVTKKGSTDSNTNYAQGGIAAALSPLDDFETHVHDTLTAGDGLCDEAAVRAMVEAAPRLIDRLLSYGVEFSREDGRDDGPYAMGREGGHTHHRILHAKDLTGRELERRLLDACHADDRIGIEENHIGLELITTTDLEPRPAGEERVVGCWVQDRASLVRVPYLADVTVLATGGCGKVYAYTSNPDIATGDGLAMAYRAGAVLANLEFVQFHPTCLYHPEAKSFLISEAVRGEGAHLINGRGERFMERYHPLKELAPRDIVARAMDQEMKLSGDPHVSLDLSHLDPEHVRARFPHLVATCARFGIDMTRDPVPVVPAAHYMCGGVVTDLQGRTSLPGLLAVGEVACTGVHGANRLASNSLLEAVYFAEQAAQVGGEMPRPLAAKARYRIKPAVGQAHDEGPEVMVVEHDWDSVRRVMWDYVGIVRNRNRLTIALDRIRAIRSTVESLARRSLWSPDLAELRNIALVAELIILCARDRRESRGLHSTTDHPAKLDGPPADTLIGGAGPLRAREFDPA
ncbi:MAG TPA: L-aspartate oxidase [Candidatus Krumholzibacteria bacterium]|nr:L-aspartate oxidase [Candidatus Krumholzibacteria bacterium]HRX50473.1 L-aspartate oxidase [Candidatus Krumholzibacteria bacterium]